MELGQLPAKGDPAVRAEGLRQVRQSSPELVGSLVEDHGPPLVPEALQMLPAALFGDGQKALESEPPRGQAADRQGADGGAAAGDGQHRHAVLRAEADQGLAGVRDGGSPGVGYQGAALPRQQAGEDGLPGGDMIVLVVADQRLFDPEVVQQLQ